MRRIDISQVGCKESRGTDVQHALCLPTASVARRQERRPILVPFSGKSTSRDPTLSGHRCYVTARPSGRSDRLSSSHRHQHCARSGRWRVCQYISRLRARYTTAVCGADCGSLPWICRPWQAGLGTTVCWTTHGWQSGLTRKCGTALCSYLTAQSKRSISDPLISPDRDGYPVPSVMAIDAGRTCCPQGRLLSWSWTIDDLTGSQVAP
jgi:hypothetical protein